MDHNTLCIEIYRKKQKTWDYIAFKAGDEVELLSLGVHFPIEEVYEDVDLPELTEDDERV